MRDESCPWLKELKDALDKQTGINSAVVLAETYGVDGDRMLKLPEVVHALCTDYSKIRLGVFDINSVNGKTMNNSYPWRLSEAETWFKDCTLVHILPYINPQSYRDIQEFWDKWVVSCQYAGLFARGSHQDLWKLKPHFSIDCVIIGMNKRPQWGKEQVTCMKVALMDNDGAFIEVGDVASGIDHQLRHYLYDEVPPKYRQWEYDTWVQITPFLIVEVEAMETFRCQKPVYTLVDTNILKQVATKDAVSLRHPRLIRFRADKHATMEDIGYNIHMTVGL